MADREVIAAGGARAGLAGRVERGGPAAGLGLAGILLTFATGSGERSSRELAVVNAETVDALADLISESETTADALTAHA